MKMLLLPQFMRDTVTSLVHEDAVTSLVHVDAVTSPVHEDAVTSPVHEDAATSLVHEDAVTSPVHEDAVTSPVHEEDVLGFSRNPVRNAKPVTPFSASKSAWNYGKYFVSENQSFPLLITALLGRSSTALA